MSDVFEAQKRLKKVLARLEKAAAKADKNQGAVLGAAERKRDDAVADLAALKEALEKATVERDSLGDDNLALKKLTADVSDRLDSAIGGLAEILEA